MADLELALNLTADSNGLRGEVRSAKGDLDKLTQTNDQVDKSGRRAGKGLDEGGRGASSFRNQAQQLNRTSGALQSTLGLLAKAGGFVVGALGGISLAMLAQDMVQTIYASEKLKGALLSAVGGIPAMADKAFAALEQFAARTPFALDQSVQAFIKMQNLGIRPTEERMAGFGNVAAAMGKDLNQMVEAVADAATGEFERLKEFGIKASSEGDKVRLTFQGVTTEIAKDSDAIVGYLTNIGNQKFGDAMENQMNRLPGLWSNLKDNINGIWRDLGDAGVTDLFSSWTSAGVEWTSDIRTALKAGWFDWVGAEMNVLWARFSGWWDLLKDAGQGYIDNTIRNWQTLFSFLGTDATSVFRGLGDVVGFVGEAIAELPTNLQTLGAIVLAEFFKMTASVQEFAGLLSNNAQQAWETVSFTFTSAMLAVKQAAVDTVEGVIRLFGDLVTQVGAALTAVNSTGLADYLVPDSVLANIQQAGTAMQQYGAISQDVTADIAAVNAEHANTVTALNAERAGIEAAAQVRKEAADELIDDALAARDASLAIRAANVQEAEAAAAAAQASYEHNAALKQVGTSIDDVTTATNTKTGATQAEVAALDKLLDRLDPARVATRQYQAGVEELAARLADGTITQSQYNAAVAALEKEATKAGDGLSKLLDRLDPTRAATRQYEESLATLNTALATGKITQTQFNTAVGALESEADKAGDALGKVLDRLDPARAATRQYNEDMTTLRAALAAGTINQTEFNTAVGALEGETARATGGVISMAEALETAAKRGFERMDDAAAGWLKNFFLTGQATFSGVKDLFLEMLAEMIYAAARNRIVLAVTTAGTGSLANAGAAEATTGGSSGLISGASSLYNGYQYLTNTGASGALSQGLGYVGQSYATSGAYVGNVLGQGNAFSQGAAELSRTYQYGTVGQGAALAAGQIGGGLIGGYAGQQVFGNENSTGIGAAGGAYAGGAVGAYFTLGSPWGAAAGSAIGAFIGEAIETGLQKVFGYKSGGNNAGGGTFNLADGTSDLALLGKNGGANLEASKSLVQTLQSFSDAIGGSTFSGGVTVGSKDGIKFAGQKYEDVDSFLQDAFRAVIKSATELDDEVKALLIDRKGDAKALARDAIDAASLNQIFKAGETYFAEIDDFGQTFEVLAQEFRRDGEGFGETFLRLETGLALLSAAGEDAARSVDNFKRAQELIDKVGIETATNIVYSMGAIGEGLSEQFQALKDAGGRSNPDIYETQVAINRALIDAYDGTAASSLALAQATVVRRETELALLAELEAVTASVTGRIASFREQLILDGLDEGGQYNRFRDQISDLADQISTAGSAAEVESLTSKIDALGKSAYGLLDDSQKDAARPEFLDWLDTIEKLATDRLDDLKQGVITTSEDVDTETQTAFWTQAGLAGETLQAAGDTLQAAGATQQDAAQALIDAAGDLSTSTASLEAALRVLRSMQPIASSVLS